MLRIFVFSLCLVVVAATASAQDTIRTLVYFPFNQSQLTAESQQHLDSLMQSTRTRELVYLKSEGHCDPVGGSKVNQRLSEARAQQVLAYLNEKGTRATFQASSGQGKRHLLVETGKPGYPHRNRRVELTLAFRRLPPPAPVSRTELPPSQPAVQVDSVVPDTTPLFEGEELKVGDILTLENIHFFGGKSEILPKSIPAVKKLLEFMQENPGLKIEIRGHVCCMSDQPLSDERAKAIYDYLVREGISKKRLKHKGYNRKYPQGSDDTEEGRTANRRVDIRILSS